MRNKLIAITAATALGLSSIAATPAKADQNLNNFLIAAGAIMIVAGVTASHHEPHPSHGVVVSKTRVVSPARHCWMHRHDIPHRHPGVPWPHHHHLGGC